VRSGKHWNVLWGEAGGAAADTAWQDQEQISTVGETLLQPS